MMSRLLSVPNFLGSLYVNKSKCIHKYTNISLNGQFMRPWDYTRHDLDSICHKQIIHSLTHSHTHGQRTELFTPSHTYECIYSCIRMSVFPNNIQYVYAYMHTSIIYTVTVGVYEISTIKSVYITVRYSVMITVSRLKLTQTISCACKTTLGFILFRHLFCSEELDLTEQERGMIFPGQFYLDVRS